MTMFIRRRVALFANPQQLKFNLPVASSSSFRFPHDERR
jgi:hypothetical protein